jgi:glycosyltransferase involved in cell wall biosynthesis
MHTGAMHIGILTNYRLDQVGGAEEAIDRLARLWRRSGHDVELFSSPSRRPQRRRPWQPDYCWRPIPRPWSTRFGLSRYVRLLRRAHAVRPFDVLFAVDAYWPGHVARELWRAEGVPYVICPQGSDIREGGRFLDRPRTRERLAAAISDAHGVATVSKYMDARLRSIAEPRGIVRNICHGWPDEWLEAAPTQPAVARPYVFSLGRFVPIKGFSTLIDAYALVYRQHPQVPLVIAGDGPELPALVDRARQHGLPVHRELPPASEGWQGICLPGFVHGELKVSLASHASVGVCPSVWQEPQGMVVLEMLCRGVPVVASRVGGIPDFVQPGLNGDLFPAGDSQALATILNRLLSDPQGRNRLAAAALPSIERFRWTNTAEAYLRLFADVAVSVTRVARTEHGCDGRGCAA